MVGRGAEIRKVSGGGSRFHGRCALLSAVCVNVVAVGQRTLALVVAAVEECAVPVVVISPQQFALAAIVVVLAVDEEAVGEVNIRILRHGTDESAAAVCLACAVRVVDESVEHAARDVAVLEVVSVKIGRTYIIILEQV